MTGGRPVVRLEDAGYSWTDGAGGRVWAACEDLPALQALAATARKSPGFAIHIPEEMTLPLHLPQMPRSPSEARRMLRDAAPLPLDALAWTRPRPGVDGGAVITVVRRAWLEPRIAKLDAVSCSVKRLLVEPEGEPLVYRLPSVRRRNAITASIIAGSVAVSAVALSLVASNRQTDIASTQSLSGADREFGVVAQTLSAIATALPSDAQIVEIEKRADGTNALRLTVADPDALRDSLAFTHAPGGWRETARVSQPNDGYSVTYRAEPGTTLTAKRALPVLSARTPRDAARMAISGLRAAADRQRIQLNVGQVADSGASLLSFGVSAAGSQAAVLAFADRIESGPPPARLTAWTIRADPLGVRLSATVLVPWARRS